MLPRRTVVSRILASRSDDMLVVAGLGSSTWDVCAQGDHAGNFCFIGAMGQAAPFALGLALAQPHKPVLLITGDGDMLMALGSLATIANQAPENLAMVVLDNETYLETGGQATATAGPTRLESIAQGAGIARVRLVTGDAELSELPQWLFASPGPSFANVKVRCEDLPRTFPHSFDGVTAINRFRDFVCR